MDDLEELKPQNIRVEMDRWNISDLKEYINKLEKEIKKVKQIISNKENATDKINNLFNSVIQKVLGPFKYIEPW